MVLLWSSILHGYHSIISITDECTKFPFLLLADFNFSGTQKFEVPYGHCSLVSWNTRPGRSMQRKPFVPGLHPLHSKHYCWLQPVPTPLSAHQRYDLRQFYCNRSAVCLYCVLDMNRSLTLTSRHPAIPQRS
jgi:hypothetical protein